MMAAHRRTYGIQILLDNILATSSFFADDSLIIANSADAAVRL